MTINTVDSLHPSANSHNAKSGGIQDLGQGEFLQLMVAQFKSQDPFQPQENGDFIAQLAQFSTSDGIAKMQLSIDKLASSLQSNQALQASALVGRKVMVNSNLVTLDNDKKVTAAVELPDKVSNLTASVYSTAGELINAIPLGQQEAGLFQFNWDGKNQQGEPMTNGNYVMEVTGVYEGRQVALKPLTAANVDSVSLGKNGEGLKLNVAGLGAVSLDEVRQITI